MTKPPFEIRPLTHFLTIHITETQTTLQRPRITPLILLSFLQFMLSSARDDRAAETGVAEDAVGETLGVDAALAVEGGAHCFGAGGEGEGCCCWESRGCPFRCWGGVGEGVGVCWSLEDGRWSALERGGRGVC